MNYVITNYNIDKRLKKCDQNVKNSRPRLNLIPTKRLVRCSADTMCEMCPMARTLSSVANLGLTFAEYSHNRWWAEFVGFAEDYLPLGDYLTLNLRAAKWPATPHVYLRDKWQIGGEGSVFSVH